MKKLVVTLALSALAGFAGEWKGHISDSKCGAAHADHSEASIKCVQGCVKGGQAPVFVTEEGKVVKIANPDSVMKHLGHQVKITGDLNGDTLTIAKVEHIAP